MLSPQSWSLARVSRCRLTASHPRRLRSRESMWTLLRIPHHDLAPGPRDMAADARHVSYSCPVASLPAARRQRRSLPANGHQRTAAPGQPPTALTCGRRPISRLPGSPLLIRAYLRGSLERWRVALRLLPRGDNDSVATGGERRVREVRHAVRAHAVPSPGPGGDASLEPAESDPEHQAHREIARREHAEPRPALARVRRVIDPGGVEKEPQVAQDDDQ